MGHRIVHTLVFPVLLTAMCVSCMTFSTEGIKSAGEEPGGTGSGPDITSMEPEKIEINGAIDFRDADFRHLLDTRPVNGHPVFFVSVTRLYNRGEEYDFGLRLLARQAAIFKEAYVSAKAQTVSTAQYEGTREKIEVDYDEETLQSLMERIDVIDYYVDNLGTYLKGILRGENLPDFDVRPANGNDVPEWFLRMPHYTGYIAAVGVSQRQMFFSDSILESEKQTIANMARQFQIEIEKKRDDIEIGGIGSGYKQQSIEIVDVKLRGFYILDRWITADGNTFYSLAVSPIR